MIGRAIQKFRELLIPGDQTSSDHRVRGAERNRRAMLTGSAAALARAVQVGTSLVTVPLTLKYLGNERFGLWMTISSVLAMAAFADFGIGNGVLNTVAKAYGKDDLLAVRQAISSGFAILVSIAAVLLSAYFALYQFVNWGDFFRVVSPQARSEAGPALTVFAVCFALNIGLDVVQRVQLGLQQGYRYSMWQLSGSLAGFAGVLASIWLQASLPVLVIAVAGAPVLATIINTVHFFGFTRPDLRPSLHLMSRQVLGQIAHLGALFFILQIVASVSYSADNFVIARTLGAVNVPEYSIPQRLFALISMMSSMLIAPLWPAYGEAISRGDIDWVRHTLRRSLTLVLSISVVASALLLAMATHLIHWWVGSRIHTSFALLAGLAVWCVIECGGNALAMFLNGAAAVRFQIVVSVTFGVICLTAKVLVVRHLGLAAIPWSTTLSYLFVEALPWMIFVPRILRRLELSHSTDSQINRAISLIAVDRHEA